MSEDKTGTSPGGQPGDSPTVRRYELSVAGYEQPFKFTVALSEFMEFQREAQRDAAMATNNFLMRTVTQPGRQELVKMFEAHWGLPGILMDKLATEMVDLRPAALKNSSGA